MKLPVCQMEINYLLHPVAIYSIKWEMNVSWQIYVQLTQYPFGREILKLFSF